VTYERNEQDFMRLVVRPGMHVADVGAHLGVHTVLLADLVGESGSVTALEPLDAHAGSLSTTIRERGLERTVTVVQAAAADAAGIRPMVVSAPQLASANAYFDLPSVASAKEGLPAVALAKGPAATSEDIVVRYVPTVMLDAVLADRPVGFLKIDVEGAEALVLRGARRLLVEDRPVVLVDVHPHLMSRLDGTTPDGLIVEMKELGYRCRLLGAGVPGSPIADVPASGATQVIFICDGVR
jgi:FkbM family methyltransferase